MVNLKQKFIKAIMILVCQGPLALVKIVLNRKYTVRSLHTINKIYQLWFNNNYPKKEQIEKQKKESKNFKLQPKISLITPVYNPQQKFLRECIDSVINQSYRNWELCLVDDASKDEKVREIIREYAKKDKRIKYFFRKVNGHICRASNDALKLATGEYIGLLDHDDFLWPNALYEVVRLLNEKPQAEFIYSDEDKLAEDGKIHLDPFFKPDWSPDYLRSVNYITHFAILKKSLVIKVGEFKVGTEGAQDWDLFLRATHFLCSRKTKLPKPLNLQIFKLSNFSYCHPLNPKNPIQHIPNILYSWRKNSSSSASEKSLNSKEYAYKNQKKVLEDDLTNRGYKGTILPTKYLGVWNIKYSIIDNPLVSVIIPTKDKYQYILKCLNSIIKKTTYKNYELIIIDTGSNDKKIFKLYEQIRNQPPRYSHEGRNPAIHILHWNKPFNFSAVCNYVAKQSSGRYLIFLNNDTEVLTPDWLEIMLGYAQLPYVGTIGVKLIYPDNRIQHAGIVFDPKNKINGMILPDHDFKNYQEGGDFRLKNSSIYGTRDYLAVSAACLMIEKRKFEQVSGFNPKFQIAFNDVDLGLKLSSLNFSNVVLNWINLLHHESTSLKKPSHLARDSKTFVQELRFLHKSWHQIIINDPFFNPNINNLTNQ